MQENDMLGALLVGIAYRMVEVSIGFENIDVWHMDTPDLLHTPARLFCGWTCVAITMLLDRFSFDTVWLDDDLAFKFFCNVSRLLNPVVKKNGSGIWNRCEWTYFARTAQRETVL